MATTMNSAAAAGTLPAQDIDTITAPFTVGERRIFRPRERITTAEWAARHRVVTNGPMTGQWRNDVTPYLAGPMETICEPGVRRIILQFAPQTGKTQVAFNFLCHMIDQAPGPMMYVMPDEKVMKRIMRRRIIPMFRGTPRIAALMGQGVSDTTALSVTFTNGMDFMVAWATSAAELSSESVRYLIRDEIDKWPSFAGKEADPLALSEIRTNAYPHTKKIIDLSTPSDESGYIGRAVADEADEIRRYHAVCPVCREPQIMRFGQFAWPKNCHDPREIVRHHLAQYQCAACGMLWTDGMRNEAVAAGYWRADFPVERPQVVAFHLPSYYSPFVSLSAIVAAYLRGLEDVGKLMIFVTQHKAQVWKESVLPKKESAILERRTALPGGIVPAGAVALTCGIDVQKDGFWFVVRAWAEDLTSWLVQYGYLANFADVETLLWRTQYPIEGEGGTMGIWRAAMDTGGGQTEDDVWTRTEYISGSGCSRPRKSMGRRGRRTSSSSGSACPSSINCPGQTSRSPAAWSCDSWTQTSSRHWSTGDWSGKRARPSGFSSMPTRGWTTPSSSWRRSCAGIDGAGPSGSGSIRRTISSIARS
jgi:phage terminase large subunit GpA-like protein